ncbi:MAG TPA: Crp/Fnr family transcriptional regulator [Flavisolibacter sp.]|nr:Crp/Fnr family transcriptional regulator [Flavisolibacter sp.]
MSLKGIFPIDKWGFNTNSVLTELPAAELERLMAHSSEQLFSKGEIIFREGSLPSGIFYMRTGMAKKYKVDKEGREQIIYVANSGEMIGYHAVLADERYPDNAAALEESLVGFIPKEDFLEVLDLSKTLSNRLLKALSHEFTVFANSVVLFAQRSVRERFAMQLILMREKYKQGTVHGMEVEINLSREDLASLVGTARENIVRIIKDFKEEEILETRGRKIIIKDVEALLKAANY